jgi:hypothetical protein
VAASRTPSSGIPGRAACRAGAWPPAARLTGFDKLSLNGFYAIKATLNKQSDSDYVLRKSLIHKDLMAMQGTYSASP